MSQGTFLLSIDTELAWGGVYNGSFRNNDSLFAHTREVVDRLLALLERYDIRATWAVVGHLFLDRCGPVGGVKHPDVVRPSYGWFRGDWFKDDPCTDVARDPFWYGPDLVERILRCRTPQEIGCHGFSHTIAGDPGCGRDSFESELLASQAAARPWGIELRSFVFPRNSIGHLDLLAAHGYSCYRGVLPKWHQRLPGPAKKVGRTLESLLPIPPMTARPRERNGLWDLPATTMYMPRGGWRRHTPVGLRVWRARTGLGMAAKSASIFHLWFHPFNLSTDPEGLLGGLEAIFRHVAALRMRGSLRSMTMAGLAGDLRASPSSEKERVEAAL